MQVKVTTVTVIKCFSSGSSLKPKTQPNDSRAAVWLSFWFSTRPLADTVSQSLINTDCMIITKHHHL